MSSGFIEKKILKTQVQSMILQKEKEDKEEKKKTHEMIFTQERMRRIRLSNKTHSKNHTTKKREKLTARGSSNTSYWALLSMTSAAELCNPLVATCKTGLKKG
jgi:hypothetical protein